MAKTNVATGSALAVELFMEQMFRDTVKESFFSNLMGEGPDNIIQTKRDLLKNKGEKMTFALRARLAGDPIEEGGAVEGNEESLILRSFTTTLKRFRFGVRDDGDLTRRRVAFNLTEEQIQALRDRGTEFIDQKWYDTLNASPTKTFFGGVATSTATLKATEKLTPTLISKVKAGSKNGFNRDQTPIRPIRIMGKKYWVLMVHQDQLFDLRQDAQWAQAAREALPRGTDNPLFSAAMYLWDQVLIMDHENVKITTDFGSGSDVPGAEALFLGAQAGCMAWGAMPSIVQETFDYEEEIGHAWRITSSFDKTIFNSLDYGVVSVKTARTKISDA